MKRSIVVIIVKNFLTEINYLYHKVLQLLQGIKNKGEDSNEGIIRNEI